MHQSTVAKLGLSVFGLVFLSFMTRVVGQFLVGFRTATLIAGPIAVLALAIMVFLIAFYLLSKVGVTTIEWEA
jgi:uncharacterized membrane protein (Fun14 family)